MKKLILLSVVLCGFCGFAQQISKTVIFENISSVTIGIAEISTVRKVSERVYDYPSFSNFNSNRSGTYLSIAPGGEFKLENAANPGKFPFVSVGNTPQLNFWQRYLSATSNSQVSSSVAFAIGLSQLFTRVKFGMLVGNNATDTGFLNNMATNENLSGGTTGTFPGINYDAMIISESNGSHYIIFY